jgi:hypothetical protein
VDEGSTAICSRRSTRPADEEALKPTCLANLNGVPTVTVSFGDCAPLAPLPDCQASTADADVQILSVSFGSRGGFDCHYSRATGALIGQAVSADSTWYCGSTGYVAASAGVRNAWCRAGGASVQSVTCAI